MKHIKLLIAFLLFPLMAFADAWETQYKQIEQSIKQPEFKNKDYAIMPAIMPLRFLWKCLICEKHL